MREINFEEWKDFLFSGLICDVMDGLGYPNQSLSHEFQPLVPEMKVFGRVFTAVMQELAAPVETPLVNQTKAIAALGKDDVYVLKTIGAYNAGVWGEILTSGAKMQGALGAVIDGYSRDSAPVIEMGFPVFSRGRDPRTAKQRAEIVAWQVPVVIDGVSVKPGDLVYADYDGVCFIPEEIVGEVLEKCRELEAAETRTRDKILSGVNIVNAFFDNGAL